MSTGYNTSPNIIETIRFDEVTEMVKSAAEEAGLTDERVLNTALTRLVQLNNIHPPVRPNKLAFDLERVKESIPLIIREIAAALAVIEEEAARAAAEAEAVQEAVQEATAAEEAVREATAAEEAVREAAVAESV